MSTLRSAAPLDIPAGSPAGKRFFGFTVHRLMVVSLAAISLVIAWNYMAAISRTDPWYRNTDMNIHSMVDALAINSDVAPKLFTQPAVPLKYLLALDYRVRHYLGLLPVWNLKKLGASADPLQEIPPLIRVQRVHSRILVMLFILSAAGLAYTVTRELDSTCLTAILLCGCASLLFHGLLTRPELLCVGFGNILALWCAWHGAALHSRAKRHAWLFLAGLLVGLSALEKVPGIVYLLPCYALCWLPGLIDLPGDPGYRPAPGNAAFWSGWLPAAGGMSVLWLLFQLGPYHDVLGPVVLLRLRIAAVIVGILPLLALRGSQNHRWLFLLDRVRELTLLVGGALAAMAFSYLLLRGVMTEPKASLYLANELNFVIHPGPHLELLKLLATAQDVSGQFLLFLKDAPVLFGGATALVLGLCLLRSFPLRLKALLVLLLATALGLSWLMSRRYFAAQYGIFAQVPLLLACAFSLSGLRSWWQRKHPAAGIHWWVPVILTGACVLMLSVFLRLQPKYDFFQDDGTLPANQRTLTFLFDHNNHVDPYLQLMKDRYGTREEFASALEQYLADPVHRF